MYILDYKKQVQRINEMIPLRKNDKTFEVFYHDPASGELWKSFFPHGKKSINSVKILRPEPLPTDLRHQLELCLNSGNPADAAGLGIEYSLHPEKWNEILIILNTNRKIYLRSGFFEFFNYLGVKNSHKVLDTLSENLKNSQLSRKELVLLKKRASMLWLKKFFWI